MVKRTPWVLLVLLCVGSVAAVLLPLVALQWSGSVHISPLFGLVVAFDLVLGGWLLLRLQDRWLHGSRFADESIEDIDRHRLTLTDCGFVLLVLTICQAACISTLGLLG